MIRFACPRCRQVFNAPDEAAGRKSTCLSCQQRLQIPLPPRTLPVPAPLVSYEPEAIPPDPADAPVGPHSGAVPVQAYRPQSRRLFYPALIFCGLVALLGLFLGLAGWTRTGQRAEQRSGTRLDEEDLVRRYVLNNSEDPKSVEFLVWGPHLLRAEFLALVRQGGIDELARREPRAVAATLATFFRVPTTDLDPFAAVVRVRFRGPEWADWGPAGHAQALRRALFEKGGPKEIVNDCLYTVYGNQVVFVGVNREGDGWKSALRRELARSFPAIDTNP
jgi:hypothetical protein